MQVVPAIDAPKLVCQRGELYCRHIFANCFLTLLVLEVHVAYEFSVHM